MRSNKGFFLVLGLLCLALPACSGCNSSSTPRLKGGGSSFIGPLMLERWAKEYRKEKNVEVDYSSKGSGFGVEGMINDSLQFGCSDAPLTEEQIKQTGGPEAVLQIPLVVGAVVPIYNLPDVEKPIQFTGELLGKIYLQEITEWGQLAVGDLNPQLKGRKDKIIPIHRSGASGTTYIWTDYLCASSEAWKNKYKVPMTSPSWTGGPGEGNNDAVAKSVGSTPGAIGYVELTFALKNPGNKFKMGKVQSADKKAFVEPNQETATAAAAQLQKVPEDLSKLSFVNAPGKDSYPIVGTTWAVVKVKQTSEHAKLLKEFLHWAVNAGQKYTVELHYVPLPKQVIEAADKKIDRIGG